MNPAKTKHKNKNKTPLLENPGAKEGDGVTHINIWIKAVTPLGRGLAHFTHSPFVHPFFGPFISMEGFWHYVKTAERDDTLRRLAGIRAKDRGKQLTRRHVKNFHEIINTANFYKIEQNEELKRLMIESTLPFKFYYFYGDHQLKIEPHGYEWLVEGFEEIRRMLREGRRPPDIDYSDFLDKKNEVA